MVVALRTDQSYTYADCLTGPDNARHGLIDSQAWLTAPAPLIEPQEVEGEVFRQLANQLEGQSGYPRIDEPKDQAPIGMLPDVSIAQDALLAPRSKPEH